MSDKRAIMFITNIGYNDAIVTPHNDCYNTV